MLLMTTTMMMMRLGDLVRQLLLRVSRWGAYLSQKREMKAERVDESREACRRHRR